MTSFKALPPFTFLLLLACGKPPPTIEDAGTRTPPPRTAVCLDNDGDGVPGTGECGAEPTVDCDDADPAVSPTALELCNGLDEDCDGQVDDAVVFQDYYPDADGDGFGAASAVKESSCSLITGKVTNNQDCNDGDAARKPGAQESCNGVDEDCDGQIDDGLTFLSYYPDLDADGHGSDTSVPQSSCAPVTNKVANDDDCDDTASDINPNAAEVCNGYDDDCDGSTDENNPGGGGACTTGQAGVCSSGTRTCQSGQLACVRNTAPSAEKCDALDNDCDGPVDEDFTNKGAACTSGLGVCQRSGTFVCKADGTGTVCSAVPGAPTAASCDGADNDCDGIVDDPAFTNTVTLDGTAWADIEVAPYYYSATSCQGGVTGSGTDSLVGGAAVMAVGASGISFQQLSSTGAAVGAPKSISTLNYADVAIAQAGDGFMIAGLWISSGESVEVDFYYVDSTGSTVRARQWGQFKRTGTNQLDGLRLMRGNGKRVTVVFRESGIGIMTARVEPFYNSSTASWSILTPTQGAAPFTATTLVANASVMAGVGADSAHIDWNASVNCGLATSLRLQAVAYIAPVTSTTHSVRYFTMAEDGTSKSAEVTLDENVNTNQVLGEPELTYYRAPSVASSTVTHQWMVLFTESGVSPANEDLRYFLSSHYDGGTVPFDYAWTALASDNGADSIRRPRLSVTGTTGWISALRYVNDPSGFKRQVMTRKILFATDTKDPTGSAVEVSATTGACATGDASCRAGNKDALTNYAAWGKVYYSNAGSPAGSNQSTLTCQ